MTHKVDLLWHGIEGTENIPDHNNTEIEINNKSGKKITTCKVKATSFLNN